MPRPLVLRITLVAVVANLVGSGEFTLASECEFQIRGRFSFIIFLGLHPGDAMPNARTVWDFKQALNGVAGVASGGCSSGLTKSSSRKG